MTLSRAQTPWSIILYDVLTAPDADSSWSERGWIETGEGGGEREGEKWRALETGCVLPASSSALPSSPRCVCDDKK